MNQALIDAKKEMDDLISNMKTVILGTVSKEGEPNSSYAPSIIDSNGNYFIYISNLSKHTLNLLDTPSLSIMIIDDESKTDNIFARRRLTMNASSVIVDRHSDKWNEVIAVMEDRLGETISFLKDMTDFHMFKLKPQDGLLVHGFAKAFKLSAKDFSLIHLNDQGHTKE